MATVSLTFSPLPAHVRTARMLAVAMARRSGLPDELLDEVRLAVGEVCSRAIKVHARLGIAAPVALSAVEDERGYLIAVTDEGDVSLAVAADLADVADLAEGTDDGDTGGDSFDSADGDLGLPAGLELALVAGLVDEMTIEAVPAGGTVVSMRWKR